MRSWHGPHSQQNCRRFSRVERRVPRYNGPMALQPDDTVCFCFHVSLRKVETFCKVEKPQHPSQISECLSAGTGCGWCVPMLKHIHRKQCGVQTPWWRQEAPVAET